MENHSSLKSHSVSVQFAFFGLFLLLGVLLFWQSLFFDLTLLDDQVWILDKHWILKDLTKMKDVLFNPDLVSAVFYRPVLSLSFMLDAQMYGQNLLGYHLTNILIHVLNSGLLFIFFLRLNFTKEQSLWASLIFLAHPALTQAVVWIPGRTDSLLATFVLLSLLCWLDFLQSNRWGMFLLQNLFFVLALFTKETAVVVPLFYVFLLLVVTVPRLVLKRLHFYFGAWGVLLISWLVIRSLVLGHSLGEPLATALQKSLLNLPSLITYLGKVFFPFNLSTFPLLKDLHPWYGLGAIAVLVVSWKCSLQKRRRIMLLGLLWYLLFLLPSLFISFVDHEYRLYLPIIGILMFLFETDLVKKILRFENLKYLLMSVSVVGLAVLTFQYSQNYQGPLSFWEDAVKHSPHSALAHKNLGVVYYFKNDYTAAIDEDQDALMLNPQEPMVYNNLGLIYAAANQVELAEQAYQNEIKLNPEYASAHFNLGLLYFRDNKIEQAIASLQKAISIDPYLFQAYYQLASIYQRNGQLDQAKQCVEKLDSWGQPIPEELKIYLLERKGKGQ